MVHGLTGRRRLKQWRETAALMWSNWARSGAVLEPENTWEDGIKVVFDWSSRYSKNWAQWFFCNGKQVQYIHWCQHIDWIYVFVCVWPKSDWRDKPQRMESALDQIWSNHQWSKFGAGWSEFAIFSHFPCAKKWHPAIGSSAERWCEDPLKPDSKRYMKTKRHMGTTYGRYSYIWAVYIWLSDVQIWSDMYIWECGWIFSPRIVMNKNVAAKDYIYIFNLRSHKQNGFSFARSQELKIFCLKWQVHLLFRWSVRVWRSPCSFVFGLNNPGSG